MKTCSLSEKLRFHANCRGTHYLGEGWSTPESQHCWSDGSRADITLCIREYSESDLILKVKCAAFLAAGEIESQIVDIYINGILLDTWIVSEKSWHEVAIKNSIIINNKIKIEFYLHRPLSPAKFGSSNDNRLLGINIDSLVLIECFNTSLSTSKLIGYGEDQIGDMYKSFNGFHRAIRNDNEEIFQRLLNSGVYENLTNKKLILENFYRQIISERYAYYVSAVTGVFIYPSNYPLLMMQDAAKTWIDINKFLLALPSDNEYGLSDGHYGNFVQIDNASPRWCDLGSIVNVPSSLSFGLTEFVCCYVVPLVMFSSPEIAEVNVRELMLQNQNGILRDNLVSIIGCNSKIEKIYEDCVNKNRVDALTYLEKIIKNIDFIHHKGYWSDYRNSDVLDMAWRGDLVRNNEDARYKAVIDLVRRSNATTFIDIGCNDGIFSLMCAGEGLKGIAIDLDEFAINKLYTFVKERPEIDISIAHGGFTDLAHTADLVLALALTHHLVLSQKLTFNAIAKILSLVAEYSVITEFMPDGLGGTPLHPEPAPSPLPVEYAIDNFLNELKKYFKIVEVIPYDRRKDQPWYSKRILIYCEK